MPSILSLWTRYWKDISYRTLSTDIFSTITALLLIYRVFKSSRLSQRSCNPLPPGPAGWPIIGNVFCLPRSKHWLTYHEWSKKYGDIIRFTSFGETTIVLSSAQVASDLFDARGLIYSDRPPSALAGEIVGWNRGLGYARFSPSSPIPTATPTATFPYPTYSDARFRALRKLFHASIGPRASSKPDLVAMQENERGRLLRRLLDAGSIDGRGTDFGDTIRQATGSLILLLTYGYQVSSTGHDPLVQIVEDAMAGFSRASDPGAFWVDRWPVLRYIPSWFPRASFHRKAAHMRHDREQLYDVPFNYVKERKMKGEALPSIVSGFLSTHRPDGDEEVAYGEANEELVKAAAASLYSGGAETTPSSLLSFLLAMLLYPEVQKRAQVELDAVLDPPYSDATGRLPTLRDRERLPFISALLKEVWRWNPSVPIGLAHRVTDNDVYRGLFIEKGATVYANIWSILHDENTYASPFSFHPERFLGADGNLKPLAKVEDPSWIAFGFGRRICPGMFLAENSIFLYIASILYVYDVLKAKDADGNDEEPEIDYTGFISHPKPFRCRLVPRSTRSEELILGGALDS